MTGLSTDDRLELSELIARYAATVDGRDWDGLAGLFTNDAVVLTPDPPRSLGPTAESRGRAAIVQTIRGVEAFALTVHHVTGTVWTYAGPDAATGRTTSVAHHVEEAESRSWVWHLVYTDRCERTGAGWQFVRRALTLQLIEARPVARFLPFNAAPTK